MSRLEPHDLVGPEFGGRLEEPRAEPASSGSLAVEPRPYPFSLSQRVLCDLVGLVDFAAVLLTAQLVAWLAVHNGVLQAGESAGLMTIAPIVAIIAALAFRTCALYEIRTLIQVSRQSSLLLIVWTILSIVASVSLLGLYSGPPFLMLAWLSLTPAVLISARAGIALLFRALLDKGPLARRVALIGSPTAIGRAAHVVNEVRLCYLAGVFEVPAEDSGQAIDEIIFAVRNGAFDDAIVLVPTLAEAGFERLVQTLATLPLRVSLLPVAGLFDVGEIVPGFTQSVSVTVSEKPVRGWAIVLKTGLDFLAALALLAVFGLPMLILGALIRLESEGPAIFRQHRSGRGGTVFTLYKFRSMYVCEDGPRIRQAERNDPRVTRIGRIIRKLSLDELPQILNVLRGEMSIVGPRPHAVAHDYHYGALVPRYWERFRVKPGITGWAQVNGYRGETKTLDEMAERIQYDVEYADDYSIWRDLWIMVMTPWTLVMRRDKAY
ncbi:MAG: exopolysaccharide biosynthesis polyprenyl glycosylphosphotransferase [Alphaproteobacteria bacterium]